MPVAARLFDPPVALPTLVHAEPEYEPVDIVDYLYLAEVVARKYYRGKEPIRDTDLFSLACQELVKCGEKYNPAIGPFDRFAMRAMRNGIIQSIRDKNCKKRKAEFEVLEEREWQDVPERLEEVQLRVEMLPNLLTGLPKDDRRLIEEIYLENKPIVDVAARLGVTRMTVYNRIDRILNKLREGLLNVHDDEG